MDPLIKEKRNELIEAHYGNIPFSALKEGEIIDMISIDSTLKKTVLGIWNNSIEQTLTSDFNQAIYELEAKGTKTEVACLSTEITAILG